MQTVLRADNIKVQFGGLVAVNDVSLALNQGQILGLIGPNGAGKSTLFNAITGFAPIAAGRVTFMEHDVTRLPPYVRTRPGMGRTSQAERPHEATTAAGNVLAAAFLNHPRRHGAGGAAAGDLGRVGLAGP